MSNVEVRRFRTYAAAAGAVVTVLLAAGVLLSIAAFETIATSQIADIRAVEYEITLAERLRWSGEVIVSAGRGFLISHDPKLLHRLLRARVEFDRGLDALSSASAVPGGEHLPLLVERTARDFIRIQERLVAARNTSSDVAELTLRFERELIPMQQALGESLDRLVEHKETTLDDVYLAAEEERYRLQSVLYGFLAASLVLALATTLYFARRVEHAYRAERAALEESRRAVVSRDDLMGMVAHDLRTPLQAIALRAVLLTKLAAAPQLREHAESITRMTRSMEHLIRTMLDVASIQAGRFSVVPAACCVDEIVRAAWPMLEPVAQTRGIALNLTMEQRDLRVTADRERILQVLTNLIGNAIKFSPTGGSISLRVQASGDDILFGVTDQGPGILPENLSLIFTRFWKRQPETKIGTGLGLFIAKNIVDAHGGRIWAESEAGRGATFYFTLPRATADSVSKPSGLILAAPSPR